MIKKHWLQTFLSWDCDDHNDDDNDNDDDDHDNDNDDNDDDMRPFHKHSVS